MNKFKIIITSYNNETWTETCLNSVLTQTYKNFKVLFFNDASTDNTLDVVKTCISDDSRFSVINLIQNHTKSLIFSKYVDDFISDDDIVLFLDGDDWLSNDDVLSSINQYYNTYDPWVAYGGMVVWNGGDDVVQPYPQNSEFPRQVINDRLYRQDTWRSSHTKTMRGFIWKSIDKSNFKSNQDGNYILGPDDLVIMFDALEKCPPGKVGRFNFNTYVYNHSQSNVVRIHDHQTKRNVNYETEIRSRQKTDLLSVITSELSGGVGNQLFQIAATVSLAKRLGYIAIFDPSTHFLPLQGQKFLTYKTNIFRNILTGTNLPIYSEYLTPTYHYTKIPQIPNGTILKGGYQSEKYFDKPLIKQLFGVSTPIKDSLLEKYGDVSSTVSIHVRRGDYLKLYPHHVFVGEEYYTKAIEKIKSYGYKKFLVFSDDIDWCKTFFKGNTFDFVSDLDYNELYLMSLCASNIIGNSTFSWWGAWLNDNACKTVIAPSTWYGPGYSNWDLKDLIPDGWIKI